MTSSIVPPENVRLDTGWEPDLPAEDSLVRQAVLAHAAWATALPRSVGRPWQDTDTWAGGATTDRGVFTNWVLLKQPVDPRGLLGEVHDVIPDGVPYLFVSPWPTPDLRPFGLGLAGHPPLMARLPSADPAPVTDLEIRRVDTADGLADAERVMVDGYPMPELQPCRRGTLFDPSLLGTVTAWVGYDGDTPLATAMSYQDGGVTLVENVAVMPAARGRGAGAAIVHAATTTDPDATAVLIASDDGQPVYQRLGYLRIERWTVWVRPGS